jgi:hypothetical protein
MVTKKRSTSATRRSGKTSKLWNLVTNQQNMLYMLAAGMVIAPAEFGGKHYADVLGLEPGWIPLFRSTIKVPTAALTLAVSERKFLVPCVASFDLEGTSGRVRVLSRRGSQRESNGIPARKGKEELAILVQAPLPMSSLSSINFRSLADKLAFESSAADVANVDLSCIDLRMDESAFDDDTTAELPESQQQRQLIQSAPNTPRALGQSVGGVLAMLYHAANRSDLGIAVFRCATGMDRETDVTFETGDPVLDELPRWIGCWRPPTSVDVRARLYWGVVHVLIAARDSGKKHPSTETAIQYLESQLSTLDGDKFQPRLAGLIDDLRGCLGFGGGTITELFERHKGSLSRPLLLFCLREQCVDLLEFSHPLLHESEYLLASILFGIRDGWLRLPRELRSPALSAFVAHRMASAEQEQHGVDLTFSAPSYPPPLRELFTPTTRPLTATQTDAGLQLVRQCKWNDCVQTRITLTEGSYPEHFTRSGLQLVLPGEVVATVELNQEAFLDHLGRWPPPEREAERRLREQLRNAAHAP